MELLVTLLTLAGVLLLLAALVTLLLPGVVALLIAWLRHDPGGPWVPHGRAVRSRIFGVLYGVLGMASLLAVQPRFFRVPLDSAEASWTADTSDTLERTRDTTLDTSDTPRWTRDTQDTLGLTGDTWDTLGRTRDILDTPGRTRDTADTRALVGEEVFPLVKSGRCVGVVVGIVDSSGTQVFGFGQTRLGWPTRPDGATVFEIGSVTHLLTTLLLARMVERGKLNLDQPLQELFPDSVSVPTYGPQAIRLEHLATYRSGLPRAPTNLGRSPLDLFPPFSDPWARYTPEKLDQFLSTHALERAPGDRFEFSDLGMGLLDRALERAGGANYETLVRREICEPLAMSDTRASLTPAMAERLAEGYVVGRGALRGWRVVSAAHAWHDPALPGAHGFHSTANDLLAFLEAQLGLSMSPLTAAMDLTRPPRYAADQESAVGLGWLTFHGRGSEQDPIVWHHGATGGYRSYLGMIERRRVGVVVLANTTADVDPLGMRLLRRLAAR